MPPAPAMGVTRMRISSLNYSVNAKCTVDINEEEIQDLKIVMHTLELKLLISY